jgi:hypothetical protein
LNRDERERARGQAKLALAVPGEDEGLGGARVDDDATAMDADRADFVRDRHFCVTRAEDQLP